MFSGDITQRKYNIKRWRGLERVKVKTYRPHIHSPVRIYDFAIVEEHDTPLFNGIRRHFGMESAEKHTTIVHDRSYSASFIDNRSEVEDWDAPEAVVSRLESRGYEIISIEEAEERYEESNLHSAVRSAIRSRERKKEREQERKERLRKKREKVEKYCQYIVDCPDCAGFYATKKKEGERTEGEIYVDGKLLHEQHHKMGCEGHLTVQL